MNKKIIEDALDAHNRALGYLTDSRTACRDVAELASRFITRLEESHEAQERAMKEVIAANHAVLQMLRGEQP